MKGSSIRSCILALTSMVCLVSGVPVLADPPIGSRLGERLEKVQVNNEAESAIAGQSWARCVVDLREKSVLMFLRAANPEAAKKPVWAFVHEIECNNFQSNSPLSEGQVVNMPTDILRGSLAEAFLRKSKIPALSANPLQRVYSRSWYQYTDRNLSVDEMATCVADTAPKGVLELLASVPYSSEEKNAISALSPNLGVCLSVGAKLLANRQGLRAALAEALFHRVIEIETGK